MSMSYIFYPEPCSDEKLYKRIINKRVLNKIRKFKFSTEDIYEENIDIIIKAELHKNDTVTNNEVYYTMDISCNVKLKSTSITKYDIRNIPITEELFKVYYIERYTSKERMDNFIDICDKGIISKILGALRVYDDEGNREWFKPNKLGYSVKLYEASKISSRCIRIEFIANPGI